MKTHIEGTNNRVVCGRMLPNKKIAVVPGRATCTNCLERYYPDVAMVKGVVKALDFIYNNKDGVAMHTLERLLVIQK